MSLEYEVILTLPDDEGYLRAKALRFKYIDDRMDWCRRNTASRDSWGYVPPVWRTCIFKFECAEDATAFKLRFQ